MLKPLILIVDDEDRFCSTLKRVMKEKGIEADTANSGMEALEKIKQRDYDVIILDLKMPGLSGIETLKEIKKFNDKIEVILLTGHSSVDSGIDGMKLGAYDYIIKPVDIDKLLEIVNSAYLLKSSRF